MAQWLRMLTVLAEDQDLVPSIHMVSHNYLQLRFPGIQCPLLASKGTTDTCGTQAYIRTYTHTQINNKQNF